MTKNFNNILEILFKYHTDNANECPSINIPFINRQKITGRGAVDMKGPLAGMIDAFIALYSQDLKYPLALLITGDEEANAFAGIKHFLKFRQFPILFSLCGEPSNLEIQTSFKGVIGYEMQCAGAGGHSAYPGGKSTVETMTTVINAVINFLKNARKIYDTKFGKTIGAIRIINSGVKSNQLPESFRMSWNLRTVKSQKIYNALLNKIVLQKMPKGAKVTSFAFDPVETKIPDALKEAIKISFKSINIQYKESTTVFFTEASLMNMQNIPTIVCGPGNPRLAHTDPAKETIKIKDIKKYSKLLQEIVKNINN